MNSSIIEYIPSPRHRMGPRTAIAVAAATSALLVSGLGYWWWGHSATGARPMAVVPQQATPHSLDNDQIQTMTERLARRLEGQPDDADGWNMLGRSYLALNRVRESLGAHAEAVKRRPQDATLLADYADAIAMSNNRRVTGEALRLTEEALKLEPDNVKALMLAGTAAFDRGNRTMAAELWDHAARVGPPDSSLVMQARAASADAKGLAREQARAN